jgi:hypothetical protein
LSEQEREVLWLILNSERFADLAPAAVFAILLDEGRYHGSIRTMYRLLAQDNLNGERRKQRVHTAYAKPELLAMRPNEVWSWDITTLSQEAAFVHFSKISRLVAPYLNQFLGGYFVLAVIDQAGVAAQGQPSLVIVFWSVSSNVSKAASDTKSVTLSFRCRRVRSIESS